MKVLVLSPFPPRADAPHGGARAIGGLVRSLAESHRIALLTLSSVGDQPVDPTLVAACDRVIEVERTDARSPLRAWRERQRIPLALRAAPGWVVGHSVRAFAAQLEHLLDGWRPDVVQIEFAVMGQYAASVGGRAPVVVVDHDASDGSSAMHRFRTGVMRSVDAVVAFTERDRASLAAHGVPVRLVCIPLALPLPSGALDPVGNGRDVLFVGSFRHPPNVDAAVRLARDLLPRIRAARPDVRLVLVGPDPPAAVRALASEHVTVTGYVPDPVPFLDAAAVVAAPLVSGGGTRVKVLDALALGKAVVATPVAVEGIDLRDGEQVRVAADDSAFATAVVELLEDAGRRASLGRSARRWAETHIDVRRSADAFGRLYDELIGERR